MDSSDVPNLEAQLRLLRHIVWHFHAVGQESPVLFAGQLPSDAPFDPPMPPGGVLIGAQVWEDAINVYVDTTLSPDEALSFYGEALRQSGWRGRTIEPAKPFGALEERFPTGADDLSEDDEDFISPDGRFTMSVSVRPTPEGVTSVALHVGSQEDQTHDPEDEAAERWIALLPALPPPAGGEEWEVSICGSPDSAERRIDVRTELNTSALAAHYEQEIARGGWRRTASDATTRSAWSAWEREGGSQDDLYLVCFVFLVPSSAPVYGVIEQVGRRERSLPEWSWCRG